MDYFGKQELMELLEHEADPSISIYMPTHHISGRETRQDSIRLKNLLEEARERLAQYLGRQQRRVKYLERVRHLVGDEQFWKHQGSGLALFLSPELSRWYRTPISFNEQVAVGGDFYLLPLLPLVQRQTRFLLLVISQHQNRLIAGDWQQFLEVELPDAPKSVADAVWYKEPEKLLQFRAQPPAAGHTAGSLHGHGDDERNPESDIIEYCRQIDRALLSQTSGKEILVLAGPEPVLGLFRRTTSYGPVAEEVMHGNFDQISSRRLYHMARKLLTPHRRAARQEYIDQYHMLAANQPERIRTSRPQMIEAATSGQVARLIINTPEPASTGFYEELTRTETSQPDWELNRTLTNTLLKGGDALITADGSLPVPAAALLRY